MNKRIALFVLTVALAFSVSAQKAKTKTTKPIKLKLKVEQTTASGLKIKLIEEGKGAQAAAGSTVSVHYTGTLADGTKFDSSRDRGQPIKFKLGVGQVIKGWDEGIAMMKVGDKAILTIPPDIAYGAQERGKIPANATLTFDVELVDVTEPVKPFDTKGKDTLSTPSGLQYIIVEKGKDDAPKAEGNKTVSVHYSGFLANGQPFDSSRERGEPLSFQLGANRVIKGWEEGIALMKVGDKMRLIIPPSLGYGAAGAGGVIPPNATLYFDVELMGVQ